MAADAIMYNITRPPQLGLLNTAITEPEDVARGVAREDEDSSDSANLHNAFARRPMIYHAVCVFEVLQPKEATDTPPRVVNAVGPPPPLAPDLGDPVCTPEGVTTEGVTEDDTERDDTAKGDTEDDTEQDDTEQDDTEQDDTEDDTEQADAEDDTEDGIEPNDALEGNTEEGFIPADATEEGFAPDDSANTFAASPEQFPDESREGESEQNADSTSFYDPEGEPETFNFDDDGAISRPRKDGQAPTRGPAAHDRFVGVEWQTTVDTWVPAPDERLVLGFVLRKNNKAPKFSEGTAYDRTMKYYQYEQELKETRDDSDEHLSVKVKCNTTDHQLLSSLDLVFTFKWQESGASRQSSIVLSLNCRNAEISDVSEPTPRHEDYSYINEARLPIKERVVTVVADYQPKPGNISARNLLGDGDFGPWATTVEALCSYAVHGAAIKLFVGNASNFPPVINALAAGFATEKAVPHCRRYWSGIKGRKIVYQRPDVVARAIEPRLAYGARVSYPGMQEFMTAEMVGLVRDAEVEKARVAVARTACRARFLAIPGLGNENALLMFVEEDPLAPLQIEDDERVRVRIHALNRADAYGDYWTGNTYPALPGTRAGDRVFMIHRPFDKQTATWLGSDPAQLGPVPSVSDIAEATAILALVDRSAVHAVDLRIEEDQKSTKRRICTLQAVWENCRREIAHDPSGFSVTREVVLANRFDILPEVDFLEGATSETCDRLSERLGQSQAAALPLFRAMPGGFALLEGPAGAGKTQLAIELCRARLDMAVQSATEGPRRGLRALFASPINANVEDIVVKAQRAFADLAPDAIVLRVYAKRTGRSLFTRETDDQRRDPRQVKFHPHAAMHDLRGAVAAARTFMRDVVGRETHVFGLDPRVTVNGLRHSPAMYLAHAIGVIEPQEGRDPSPAAVARMKECIGAAVLSDLRAAFDTYDSMRTVGEEESAQLASCLRAATAALYAISDAIVTTVQLAADPSLYLLVRPTVFGLDEAAQPISADGLVWAWYPGCKLRLLLGDPKQSRPRVRSSPAENAFAQQMSLAFFTRLRLAGFATATLEGQHRYCEQIGALLGEVFYDGALVCAKLSSDHERFHPVAKALTAQSQVNRNVLLIDIPGTGEERVAVGRSKFNRQTAAAAWKAVQMSEHHGYGAHEIGILTPYKAQRTIHESIAFGLNAASCDGDQSDTPTHAYLLETAERSQSLQRRVLIFDVPTTEALGFVGEATRICTALSRVQHGLIIIADVAAIESCRGAPSKAIGRVITWCKRNGHWFQRSRIPADDPVFAHMPIIESRETISDRPSDTVDIASLAPDLPATGNDTAAEDGNPAGTMSPEQMMSRIQDLERQIADLNPGEHTQ